MLAVIGYVTIGTGFGNNVGILHDDGAVGAVDDGEEEEVEGRAT